MCEKVGILDRVKILRSFIARNLYFALCKVRKVTKKLTLERLKHKIFIRDIED